MFRPFFPYIYIKYKYNLRIYILFFFFKKKNLQRMSNWKKWKERKKNVRRMTFSSLLMIYCQLFIFMSDFVFFSSSRLQGRRCQFQVNSFCSFWGMSELKKSLLSILHNLHQTVYLSYPECDFCVMII